MVSSSVSHMQLFKKKSLNFIDFIRDISDKYKNTVDIDVENLNDILDKLTLATKNSTRLIADNMTNWLGPYIDQIIRGDDDFFSNMNLGKEGVEDKYLPISNSIRQMWFKIVEGEKDQLCNYFRLIITLGVLSTEKQDLLDKINVHRPNGKKLSL